MSFFTSLTFYRPTSPPAVTAADFSRFIAQIHDGVALTTSGLEMLRVKFGDAIDQDDEGTLWGEELTPAISIMHDIEWDVDLSDDSTIQEIIEALVSDSRRIYRARVTLGMPEDDVLRPITRENSPENEIGFYPDTLSIEIGPIRCFSLGSERSFHVGWIGLTISGGGYLFPWTFRDVFDRLQGSKQIQQLTNVCRSFWPVAKKPPEHRIIQLRKKLNELWPYARFDEPWDWYWGLRESG